MIKFSKSLFIYCLLFNSLTFSLLAQTDDDIEGFLESGKNCYKKGLLNEAALEFENVLIIDKTNFLARLWLAQIYIDKKDTVNARKLLTEASIQAPDHPRVKELQKLLGESDRYVKQDLIDPVIAETIGGIASTTASHRKYGLVIPENKIIEEKLEKKLLISTREAFNEKKEIIDKVEKRHSENAELNKKYFSDSAGPLEPVFQAYNTQGLNQALDIYFELLIKDPTIASKDDKGIVEEGTKIYSARFLEDSKNMETRYYHGILLYVNGFYGESNEVLTPLRSNPGKYKYKLQPYFQALDKWVEQENLRIAAEKREEEMRIAREARAKAKAAAEKDDVWANVKKRGQEKNGDLAEISRKEAEIIHEDGYKLYKKGKLDDAIAKYNEALKKDPNNMEYNYHLALAWMDKGLAGDATAYDKAISSYQKVIAVDPDSKLAKDAASMIKDIRNAKRSLGEK